jgi:biotin carboxyl carrier protein
MPSEMAPRLRAEREPAPEPAEPVDDDADTFFEEADLDRALQNFSGADPSADPSTRAAEGAGVGELDGCIAGSIDVDYRAGGWDGYDASHRYDARAGQFGEGPFELPRMDPVERGMSPAQGRAHSVPPFLPLAPPLPPTDLAAYQSAAFGSVTGSYPAYTGQIPYIVQPVITAPAPAGARWAVVLVFALLATMAVGVGLGWLLFASARPGGDVQATRTAAAPPMGSSPAASAAKVASGAASTEGAPASAATQGGRDSEPVAADITSLAHPPLGRVTSPLRGEIALSAVRAARSVRKGDKLFEVRRKRSGGEAEEKLAARVAELERLAAEDKVYEAFLARAKSEYARAHKGGAVTVSVKASSDGLAAPTVKRGDHVVQGQTLATISDPRTWKAKASLRADGVTREWRCSITARDGTSRTSCDIEKISWTEEGAEVIASVKAEQAPWLGSSDSRLRLLLEPPVRR